MRVALATVCVVTALLAGCGDDGGTDGDAPMVHTGVDGDVDADAIVLEFDGGEFVGGSRQENVALGETVTIRVEGEVDDEIHVHGYDLYLRPLEGEDELEFAALIPGTFEVELEGSGRLLLRMTVS